MERTSCFLCELECDSYTDFDTDDHHCKCQRCGEYSVTYHASFDKDLRGVWSLMAATRQASEAGKPIRLEMENWRDLARAHANTTIKTKIRKLLEHLRQHAKPGHHLRIDSALDYPLFDASGETEAEFIKQQCVELGYILGPLPGCCLTAKGWEYLEPETTGIPGLGFVAMSFDGSLEPVYETGIRAAIEEDCKLKSRRIDKVHHNEKICDKILAEIRLAQFVVADFTLQRPGVYFEAGFAMALGRPVIWSCREDDFNQLHFDTRQYNHIKWTDPADLREQLADRIRATIPGVLE